jgi:hypothetical protein
VTVRVTYEAARLQEPGLYVGTVWARPATDTIGGASFGLTNTVVVPYRLEQPLEVNGMLTPGAVARYFLAVPDGAPGLQVQLGLRDGAVGATLYLFEPDGLPYRNGSSVQAGPGRRVAGIVVAQEDVRPGVYEAVVVAPPTESAAFWLRAAVPPVRFIAGGNSERIALENAVGRTIAGTLGTRAVGTRYRRRLAGTTDARQRTPFAVPDSVNALRLQVQVPRDVWRRLTDLGVTVFDAAGHKLGDGPMHYTIGRQTVQLDGIAAGDTVVVEVSPAFADPAGEAAWETELRADFLRSEPLDLLVDAERTASFTLDPGALRAFLVSWPADSLAGPWKGPVVVEHTVRLEDETTIRLTDTMERQ